MGLVWSLMASQLRALSSEKFRDRPQDELGVDVSLQEFYVGWSTNHGSEVPSMGRLVKINVTPHAWVYRKILSPRFINKANRQEHIQD